MVPKQASPGSDGDRPGLLDAAARGLKGLLRSTRFKLDLRTLFHRIDPAHGPELVRVALWTDPSLVLALAAAVPKAVQAGIRMLAEGLDQSERLGVAVLAGFLAEHAKQAQLGLAGRTAGRLTGLSLRLAGAGQDWPSLVREYTRGFAEGLPLAQWTDMAETNAALAEQVLADHPEWIAAAAEALRGVLDQHPALVRDGLAPLLRPILAALESGPAGGQSG